MNPHERPMCSAWLDLSSAGSEAAEILDQAAAYLDFIGWIFQ